MPRRAKTPTVLNFLKSILTFFIHHNAQKSRVKGKSSYETISRENTSSKKHSRAPTIMLLTSKKK